MQLGISKNIGRAASMYSVLKNQRFAAKAADLLPFVTGMPVIGANKRDDESSPSRLD
jgi:hypothetical protein